MALKWTGILAAVVAVTLTVTANVLTTDGGQVPGMINIIGIATAATATLIAVVADLYVRINTKLDQLREMMITRLDLLDAQTGDRNAGFVEGYLVGHAPEGSVVPLTPRGKRAVGVGDDQRA